MHPLQDRGRYNKYGYARHGFSPMKRKIVRLINALLKPLDCELVRTSRRMTPGNTYMKDPALRSEMVKELAGLAEASFQQVQPSIPEEKVDFEKEILSFFELYRNKPFENNDGGSGFHNFFWIYLVVRILKPDLVVESGVWKGQMTWLFDQALPESAILGFDIDLGYVQPENYSRATFHQMDWNRHDFSGHEWRKPLAFFDCHVNHAQRIIEAQERGISHILLDDNFPMNRLYLNRVPPVPSADMILHHEIVEDTTIEFVHRGEAMNFPVSMEECNRARELIDTHHVFPNVGRISGYGGHSYLTYVRLKG